MDQLIFKSKFINFVILFTKLINTEYQCQYLITNQTSQELFKITEIVIDFIISPSYDSNRVEIVILLNIPSTYSSILIPPSNLILAVVGNNDIGITALNHVTNLDRLIFVIFYPNKSLFYSSFHMENQMKDRDDCDYLNHRIYLHVWPKIIKVEDEAIFVLNKLFYSNNNSTSQIELNNDNYIIFVYSNEIKINIQIWEIYNIKGIKIIKKVNFIINEMGTLNWDELIRKIPRRANFLGVEITAIAGDDPDYNFEAKFVDDKNLSVLESGSAVQMLWVLRDTLNFSVRAVRGESWIEELENGNRSNMTIALINGEADICISLQSLTIQTAMHLAYLQPTDVETIKAFFVQPSDSAVRDLFLTVYSPVMWILFIVVFVALGVILRTLIWIHTKRPRWFKYEEMSLTEESFLWSVAIICQQGWYNTPYFVSTKVVFICGYFTGFICYVVFSAAIVSKLSVEIKPISNFDDLINFNYILYADKDTAQYQFILPDVPNGQMKSMEAEGMDLSNAFKKIVASKSALLSYNDVLFMSSKNIKSENLLCEMLSSLPAIKSQVPFSMFVKKNSQFREFFNQKTIFMKERGLNQRFDMQYNDGVKLDCTENLNFKKQLGLSDLFTTIIVIFVGFTISFIILLAERFHKIVLSVGVAYKLNEISFNFK